MRAFLEVEVLHEPPKTCNIQLNVASFVPVQGGPKPGPPFGPSEPGSRVSDFNRALRQEVSRSYRVPKRARGLAAHRGIAVSAAGGTSRDAARRVQFDVRRQIRREIDRIAGFFVLFQCELIGRTVDLP